MAKEFSSTGFLRKKAKKTKGGAKKKLQDDSGKTPDQKLKKVRKEGEECTFSAQGKNLGRRRRAAEKRQREKEVKEQARLLNPESESVETTKVGKDKKDKENKKDKKKKKGKEKKSEEAGQVEKADLTHGVPKGPGLEVTKSIKKSPAKGGVLDKLKSHLSGGHFRFLNESLYTTTGDAAFSTFSSQPELFDQYHAGFREQTVKWPAQPIHVCRDWLSKKPKDWKVADFGCGDAQLAKEVKQKVMSLDLVARTPDVIACNMAHTPLEDTSMNAVVFCLALMGTDYGSFLVEAHRVLLPMGALWIAEVRSRLEKENKDVDVTKDFLAALKRVGFEMVRQDSSNKMFVVFELKKSADKKPVPTPATIVWPDLKACVYKKR